MYDLAIINFGQSINSTILFCSTPFSDDASDEMLVAIVISMQRAIRTTYARLFLWLSAEQN